MASHGSRRARIEPTIVAFAATIGSLLGIRAAVAQQPEGLTVDVGKCVGLESPDERFACYEAAAEAAKTQPRAAATAQPPAATAPAPAATPQAPVATAQPPAANGAAPPAQPAAGGVAGAAAAPAQAPDASVGRERKRAPEEFTATVTGLRETVPNAFSITLDNGQVWRQVRPESWYRLRSGQKVRLYSTGWGSSFRLEAEGTNGFIQVERVK